MWQSRGTCPSLLLSKAPAYFTLLFWVCAAWGGLYHWLVSVEGCCQLVSVCCGVLECVDNVVTGVGTKKIKRVIVSLCVCVCVCGQLLYSLLLTPPLPLLSYSPKTFIFYFSLFLEFSCQVSDCPEKHRRLTAWWSCLLTDTVLAILVYSVTQVSPIHATT